MMSSTNESMFFFAFLSSMNNPIGEKNKTINNFYLDEVKVRITGWNL